MSAIQSHKGGDASRPEPSAQSPAMRLLDESRLGGVLDVRALVDGVSQLAQLNPQGAVKVLEELTTVLPPLDLARLTSHVTGVVTTVGQGIQRTVGALSHGLNDAADALTRTTASLGPDLSRRLDAVGSSLARQPETGGLQVLRPEPIGVGETGNRALGQVMPIGERQTLADIQVAGVARVSTEAATGIERTAIIGRNTATGSVDAHGRPVRAEAILREVFTDLERSGDETRSQVKAADVGVEGDYGGHTVGYRFVKEQGLDNLFPQNGYAEISDYRALENEMGDWVDAGAEVRVTVDLLGGGDRPVRVRVAYEVSSAASGDVLYENNVVFTNEADRTFDRAPSLNMKTMPGG